MLFSTRFLGPDSSLSNLIIFHKEKFGARKPRIGAAAKQRHREHSLLYALVQPSSV